VSESLKSAKR